MSSAKVKQGKSDALAVSDELNRKLALPGSSYGAREGLNILCVILVMILSWATIETMSWRRLKDSSENGNESCQTCPLKATQ